MARSYGADSGAGSGAASFAEQMQKLLSHPGLRREYGKAARSKIRKDHRLDDRVTKVENVYSSLV